MRRKKLTNFVRDSHSLPSISTYRPLSEYRTVFKSLLIGSFILIAIVLALLFVSYFLFHNTFVINRILLCVGGLIYLACAYFAWIHNRPSLASRMLIFFYFAIASVVILGWGVNTPFGLLIFAIGIILSGILLGSRHTLYAAVTAIFLLFVLQTVIALHKTPLFVASGFPSRYEDAVAYSILLAILALIAWFFGKQTEQLLLQNYQAEQALLKEKSLLESRVRKRTEQLRKTQLDEMEQLYQFAEVGQLSTALLHDLANHLSVLNFDIADLKKQQHSQTVRHVEESIGYLEQIINQVRRQLQGKNEVSYFNVAECVKDSIKISKQKAEATSVILALNTSKKDSSMLHGDSLRLSHIVNILVQNAIEAYEKSPVKERVVTITVEQTETVVIIRVRDKGNVIPLEKRARLFAPLQSTKKDGLGIGLFIARKIAETHFKGNLTLSDTTNYTEFVIELPKAKHVAGNYN
jgi:signal transduction histidine kinase